MRKPATVLLGTWFGAAVSLDGQVHEGDWTPLGGCFGRVATRCGLAGLGYVTGLDVDCEACCRIVGDRD